MHDASNFFLLGFALGKRIHRKPITIYKARKTLRGGGV